MATWPVLAELKARLDVTSTDWDDPHLERTLAAAVATTKTRIGDWVDGVDTPDDAVAQSALELAFEWSTRADEAPLPGTSKSLQLLYGHRRRFGTA